MKLQNHLPSQSSNPVVGQPTKRYRRLRVVLCIAGLFSAIAGTALWILGEKLLEPANQKVGAPPASLHATVTTLQSKSGSVLATWFTRVDDACGIVVLLHPIRADRRAMVARAELLVKANYSVVLIDMQAHGESKGNNITAGYLERLDVLAAVDFARQLQPFRPIGVIGWSLGGAAALLASPLNIDALILESVYPTIDDAVRDRLQIRVGPLASYFAPLLLWQIPPRLGISTSQLRPIDHIAKVSCPILLLAGDLDQHTPIDETQRMFDLAIKPKALQIFPGAAHVDFFAFDRQKYSDSVLPFLAKHCTLKP